MKDYVIKVQTNREKRKTKEKDKKHWGGNEIALAQTDKYIY